MPCSTCPPETSLPCNPGYRLARHVSGKFASAGKINAQKGPHASASSPTDVPVTCPSATIFSIKPPNIQDAYMHKLPWPPQVPDLHGFECEKYLRTHLLLVSKHAEHARGIDGRLPTDPGPQLPPPRYLPLRLLHPGMPPHLQRARWHSYFYAYPLNIHLTKTLSATWITPTWWRMCWAAIIPLSSSTLACQKFFFTFPASEPPKIPTLAGGPPAPRSRHTSVRSAQRSPSSRSQPPGSVLLIWAPHLD